MHDGDLDGFGAGDFLPLIVPVGLWVEHVGTDSGARGGIFETLDEFRVPAIVRPRRYEG